MSCARCKSAVCDGQTIVCLGCGTEQCFNNGLGRGNCSVCFYGILPGWSGWKRSCGYAGCTNQAAFSNVRGGVKNVCHPCATRPRIAVHNGAGRIATKISLKEYVMERLTHAASCCGVVPLGEQTTRRLVMGLEQPQTPPIEPAKLAHFVAIQAAIGEPLAKQARALVVELNAIELRAWLDELVQLSIPDAAAKLRHMFDGVVP